MFYVGALTMLVEGVALVFLIWSGLDGKLEEGTFSDIMELVILWWLIQGKCGWFYCVPNGRN
jgi:hypothetical protein